MKRIVPGIHSVVEVFKVRPKSITEIWLKDGELGPDLENFLIQAQGRKIPVRRVSVKGLERHSQSHQGVIAFVDGGPGWLTRADLNSCESGLIIALDQLEDPHNVGSVVRTAWNLNAMGLIVTRDHSGSAAPAAQKVASGGFEHLPVLEATNLHSELIALKELGFWVYGLSENGEQSLLKTSFAPKTILVIGSEESGLRKPVASACDSLIAIPQNPKASSYNAAVAGAIAGFEFVRQRSLSEKPRVST